ncbi:hypothetical protein [Mesobacillus campisalis]|nr:hypothetical protein [Mesobacillus campisalis]
MEDQNFDIEGEVVLLRWMEDQNFDIEGKVVLHGGNGGPEFQY